MVLGLAESLTRVPLVAWRVDDSLQLPAKAESSEKMVKPGIKHDKTYAGSQ